MFSFILSFFSFFLKGVGVGRGGVAAAGGKKLTFRNMLITFETQTLQL